MKDRYRYLAMLIVVMLPMIIGFAYALLFEQNIAVNTGYVNDVPTYEYGRPGEYLGVFLEIPWLIFAVIVLSPIIIGKLPEK
ncbi:MAG: hypothetical protein ABSD73_02360 [Candidatus Bathyarchaeia archaeon]|jgi:hypothetical protein